MGIEKTIFDSCILIDYLNGIEEAKNTIQKYREKYISIISWIEVIAGTAEVDKEDVLIFLKQFKLINLDIDIANKTVLLRKELKLKLPDAMIYATARNLSGILITRNTKDFQENDIDIKIPYRI